MRIVFAAALQLAIASGGACAAGIAESSGKTLQDQSSPVSGPVSGPVSTSTRSGSPNSFVGGEDFIGWQRN